jgi:hypothetical protein
LLLDRAEFLNAQRSECDEQINPTDTAMWRIEPLILPLMVATLLLIAAIHAGHGGAVARQPSYGLLTAADPAR